MTARGQLAFAHARVRAWKGRLLRRIDILPLLGTSADPDRTLEALGIGNEPFTGLLQLYQLLIQSYRDEAPLFRAMLRLHEIENVKLAWRAIVRRIDRSRWTPLWLLLGKLASVEIGSVGNSLRDFVADLAKTPYGTIADRVMLAHGDDLAAAEMAFDRWASAELLRTSAALRKPARRLIESIIRERDAQLFVRGEQSYGLSSGAIRTGALIARSGEDPFAIRQERLRLCRRAFTDDPFQVAPAIAVLLLYEEQLRGLTALRERRGDDTLDEIVSKQLASSLMGVA